MIDDDLEFKIRRKTVDQYASKSIVKQALSVAMSSQKPQAVMKMVSFGKGQKQVKNLARYITSKENSDATVETHDGEVMDLDEMMGEVDRWFDGETKKRKNQRDAIHMVLSAPQGESLEATRKAVRGFAQKTFSDNDYFFAMHGDTKHPHAHIVIRNNHGKKLRHDKETLKEWRSEFAKELRGQGIDVASSSRVSRGIWNKSTKMAIKKMRERGVTPETDKKKVEQAERELKEGKGDSKYDKYLKEMYQSAKKLYLGIASEIKKSGVKDSDKIAKILTDHANSLSEPKTEMKKIKEGLVEAKQKQNTKGSAEDRRKSKQTDIER